MLAGPQAVTLIGEGPMEDTHPDRATLGRQGDLLPLAAHPRHPHTPPPHNPTSNTRVTLATRRAQVEHQCRHLAVCTADLLEVQVLSRPLLVVHRGRPQVERHHLEAHQAPIQHRGHPLAILGPSEAPLALGLPVLCIQDLLDGADQATQVRVPATVPGHLEALLAVHDLGDLLVLDTQAMGIPRMEDHHQCMGTVGRLVHKVPRDLARVDQDNIDLRLGPDPNAKCPLAGGRCITSLLSLWSAPNPSSTAGKGSRKLTSSQLRGGGL